MSSLVRRLVFFLGIMVLIGVAQMFSGQARLAVTLALILVLSVSVFCLIGADYVRARRSREKGAGEVQREDVYRAIAEKVARARGEKS